MTQVAANWGTAQLGDQRGKTAIVTGASSGIGLHTALELGRTGAAVVLACRDRARGEAALARLRAAAGRAACRVELVDLAELASVRAFAGRWLAAGEPLDVLVNNAGIMAVPARELTPDGFERQFASNVLGHFALTGLLLPALRKSPAPRVVSVSSGAAYFAVLELDNLQGEKKYSPMGSYAQSKLANLLFMHELGRRAPWLVSVAAHPGATQTDLQRHTGLTGKLMMSVIGQRAEAGALPSLYAAAGAARSGEFFGPGKRFNMHGPPVRVRMPARAENAVLARGLWEACERLSGVRYELS